MLNTKAAKQIHVISEFVDKRTNSTGYFWYKIIDAIRLKFENVTVISTAESSELASTDNDGVTHYSIGHSKKGVGNSFLTKLINNIFLSCRLAMRVASVTKKGDIIFSGTNPSFLILTVAILKPFLRTKWVVLVNDVFPDNLVPAKLIAKNSMLYKSLKYVFALAYRQADKIIVIGRDMRDVMHDKTFGKVPIEYIPNWIDLDDLEILPDERSGNDLSSERKGKIVFQFFGNMGIVQGIETLLEAISKTKAKNIKFRFVGNGSGYKLVEKFICENQHLDIELHPAVPFNENMSVLKECDVAIVSLANDMNGLAVPSKAYFSMAADKPLFVIGEAHSELYSLLNESPEIGWFCDSGNISLISKKIDAISELDLKKFKGKPLETITCSYNYNILKHKYTDLLDDLCR